MRSLRKRRVPEIRPEMTPTGRSLFAVADKAAEVAWTLRFRPGEPEFNRLLTELRSRLLKLNEVMAADEDGLTQP